MEIFHETYDFYMTPTTAMLPAKIGELDPSPFEKLAMQFSGSLGVGGVLKKAGIVEQVAENNSKKNAFYAAGKPYWTACDDDSTPYLSRGTACWCSIYVCKREGRLIVFISWAAREFRPLGASAK